MALDRTNVINLETRRIPSPTTQPTHLLISGIILLIQNRYLFIYP